AAPPNCFRAHDRCRPRIAGESEKTFDSRAEFLCLHVIGVAAKRYAAPRCIVRVWPRFSSSTQLGKMFIANPARVQRFRQCFSIELRIPLRPRQRSHVNQRLDSVFFQQRNERSEEHTSELQSLAYLV